ncbi:acetyltransferase [Synechococcus sp. PCC 7502]|uniref:GNAT family N-acetyltransferase n=1 Tax=Synechococcus sp. PCC 7502 TaxID=1173263 RepID=UPI00029FF189|nr:GNAT family N-acetyltransferase [Synechococcus sp. PCC 7502]AFY75377.1 acetyltransferase [Synechococcus sp. PCC 7502]
MSLTNDFVLRSPTSKDVSAIFNLIQALAEYEQLSHTVTGTVEALELDLFGDRPVIEAVVAEIDAQIVGFALFFRNYSTFLTKSGIYLEDIFVLPAYRGAGIGKALIKYLASLTVSRGYGRLEWSVLDWNQPAISFYEAIGAKVLPDWRICRLTGEDLIKLGTSSG